MNSASTPQTPKLTGNTLVMFEPGRKAKEVERAISNTLGARLVHSRDFAKVDAGLMDAFDETGALSLDRLGIAIIGAENKTGISIAATTLATAPGVSHVRPEFWQHAINDWQARHGAWVREGLSLLADYPQRDYSVALSMPAAFTSQGSATWGIAATGVENSAFSGLGIKIAVLDTGLDLSHTAFSGRTIVSRSFVPGESEHDLQGHGTHCIGTACGPRAPIEQIRYGVAYESDIYVGKVLNNLGSGQEGWIFAGMEWAVTQGCEIISMSLGLPVPLGAPQDPFYENAGRFALEHGSLIIAAAGNESWRQYNSIQPVAAPANSESIMAVGAVDAKFKVANFSSGGLNLPGGEVNIAGPGVDILSTFPMPRGYERLSGTSMATPHVAGIAALYAQSNPNLRGKALWDAMERRALNISLPARDVGAGLIQAP